MTTRFGPVSAFKKGALDDAQTIEMMGRSISLITVAKSFVEKSGPRKLNFVVSLNDVPCPKNTSQSGWSPCPALPIASKVN